MRNRFLLIILGLLLLQFPGVAQDSRGQSGDAKPVLFRGRVSKRYLTTTFIGTPMWDTTGFRKGSVVYNGRLYQDVLVDIDAFAGEINVKPSEQFSPVTPDREQIPWFTKEEGRFVNLKYLGVPDAKDGFYQVLYDGKRALLKRVRKTKESGQGNHNNVMSIGYVDGRGEDFRNTLYWHPLIELQPGETKKLTVRTPGYPGIFKVTAEGLSASGMPVRSETGFEVRQGPEAL